MVEENTDQVDMGNEGNQVIEPQPDSTAQRVEPLNPELQTAPEPPIQTSESPQEPAENQVSPEPQAEPVSSETSQPVEPIPASAEGFNVATPEPVSEPVPQPEQETASELTSQPEPTPESAPDSTSSTTLTTGSSPQATPEPQVIASAFSVSRARELLIKARDVIQFRKRKKLEKIMSLFLKKQSITNDDVQMLVYVSDATATRYLQQLEREGRIKKENAGKYLSYSRM